MSISSVTTKLEASLLAGSAVDLNDIEKAIQLAVEDNDPQTVYYLNPRAAATAPQDESDQLMRSVFVTECIWATKIEATVRAQFGAGTTKERHTIQASWDRASYRAKLTDFLARTTPWLAQDRVFSSSNHNTLTGDYYTDKQSCQQIVHDYLKDQIPEVHSDRLFIIEKMIAEMLVLTEDKVQQMQRFSVLMPLLADTSASDQLAIRVITFSFAKSKDDSSKIVLDVSNTSYQAILNLNLFGQQQFDQKLLDLGKAIVQNITLDVIT